VCSRIDRARRRDESFVVVEVSATRFVRVVEAAIRTCNALAPSSVWPSSGIAIASALSVGVGLRGAEISESRSQGRGISWCFTMSPGRSAACVMPERPAQDERRLS